MCDKEKRRSELAAPHARKTHLAAFQPGAANFHRQKAFLLQATDVCSDTSQSVKEFRHRTLFHSLVAGNDKSAFLRCQQRRDETSHCSCVLAVESVVFLCFKLFEHLFQQHCVVGLRQIFYLQTFATQIVDNQPSVGETFGSGQLPLVRTIVIQFW